MNSPSSRSRDSRSRSSSPTFRQDQEENDNNRSDNGSIHSSQSGSDGESGDENNKHYSSEDEKKKDEEKKPTRKSTKPKGPVRRMMISDDMLTGSKGLGQLTELFKDFEFKGKGKEMEDMTKMLSTIERWIHSLHPKYPFDQCLERIEVLGLKKKSIKTYLKKMRMGMLPMYTDEKDIIDDDDDDHLFPTEEDLHGMETEMQNSRQDKPNEDEFPTEDDLNGMETEIQNARTIISDDDEFLTEDDVNGMETEIKNSLPVPELPDKPENDGFPTEEDELDMEGEM